MTVSRLNGTEVSAIAGVWLAVTKPACMRTGSLWLALQLTLLRLLCTGQIEKDADAQCDHTGGITRIVHEEQKLTSCLWYVPSTMLTIWLVSHERDACR